MTTWSERAEKREEFERDLAAQRPATHKGGKRAGAGRKPNTGKGLPAGRTVTVSLKLAPVVWDRIKERAEALGMKPATLIAKHLTDIYE